MQNGQAQASLASDEKVPTVIMPFKYIYGTARSVNDLTVAGAMAYLTDFKS